MIIFNRFLVSTIVQKVILLQMSFLKIIFQRFFNIIIYHTQQNASGFICIFTFKINCICIWIFYEEGLVFIGQLILEIIGRYTQ